MKIWIDGDACPRPIKQILFRAAIKRAVPIYIVANHFSQIPNSPLIRRILVESGFDKADSYIVEHIQPSDLVITSDILLADLVLAKSAFALNPKGVLFTNNNIKSMVSARNINESLRSSGLIQGGPSALQPKEIVAFSNHLDKLITAHKK